MRCNRCGNENDFFTINNRSYCRKCIEFGRVFVDDSIKDEYISFTKVCDNYDLPYKLTSQQNDISDKLCDSFLNHKNSLVYAVCGAGKTEIVFKVIECALSQGKRIAFCLPRRDLAIEIYDRILSHFHNVDISLLYGGHTMDQYGQIIVCTTHQMYRFPKAFDLLILDEIDAFPYANNQVLKNIVTQACIGNYIYLSATPSREQLETSNHDVYILNKRFHQAPLPIPRLVKLPEYTFKLYLIIKLREYQKKNLPCIIYLNSISEVKKYTKFLQKIGFKIEEIHSKKTNRQQLIKKVRDRELLFIVSTTILERGVTFENVQVIVVNANRNVFSKSTLVQIAGRVGRKTNYPDGEVIFLSSTISLAMKECVDSLQELNTINV